MLFNFIVEIATQIIETLGYPGIFILMALESTAMPVPSEAVMPFAGFLIAQSKLNFWLVMIVSTLAGIVGSLISYAIGAFGGKPLLERYGKYILIQKEELDKTEKWFKKKGSMTILISRFIPGVRHVISIPAGIGRMALAPFIIFTAIGVFLWNLFLVWLGVILEENYHLIPKYSSIIDIFVVIGIIFIIIYFVKKIKHK